MNDRGYGQQQAPCEVALTVQPVALVVNHLNNVARLYDAVKDNPNELNIGRDNDGNVVVGMEDRDSGNVELWITVDEDQLLAALAVTKTRHVSQD
jgi:hypothetical protein